MEWLNSLVSSLFQASMDQTLKQTFELVQDIITSINMVGVSMFSDKGIQSIVHLFASLGFCLFAIGVILAIVDLAIEQEGGKADIKSLFLNFIKAFISVELFTILPIYLYSYAVDMQSKACSNFLGVYLDETTWGMFNANGTTIAPNSITSWIWIIAVCYGVIKVFLGNLKRGGILLTLICVGSLYMLNLPRGYSDGFMGWIKQVIALCFTTFMQTTLLYIGMITMGTNFLVGLGIILAAAEVPRIADRFGLDTSTRTPGLSSVAMTANSVMSGIRMIRTK